MRDVEPELEAKLENLMGLLEQSDLEAEAEWEAEVSRKARGTRCTPVGVRVGTFACNDADHSQVEQFLAMSVPVATLRGVVEAAADGAVSLATSAAQALDPANRTNSTRSTFCEAFGVMPEFVPPWRASLRPPVHWKDL